MRRSANHNSSPHCLVFDPIPFNGGSKIASREILQQGLTSGITFTILTLDESSWKTDQLKHNDHVNILGFSAPKFLYTATSGLKFWLKQLYYFLCIAIFLIKNRDVNTLVGISGPGVDMALYFCQPLFPVRIIQFIHGPVSSSYSIGYCLTKANKVFYLESCKTSLLEALNRYFDRTVAENTGCELAQLTVASSRYHPFENGIGAHNWPTPCKSQTPRFFWAASLLKWKGLDKLIHAVQLLPSDQKISMDICFIRPQNIALPQSKAPVNIDGFTWHCEPDDLDNIRSHCNIFISTSDNEPFGLSVLESLAAGMCVVIPQDNAYWDTHLTHNVNCIKYLPNSHESLAKVIQMLIAKPKRIQHVGEAGRKYADHYQAEKNYHHIVTTLAERNVKTIATPHKTESQ